jgi:uncharacterized membrane protein HdeD (DUF308 family)
MRCGKVAAWLTAGRSVRSVRGVDDPSTGGRPQRSRSLRLWLAGYLLVRAVVITVLGLLMLLRPTDTVLTVVRFIGVVLLVLTALDLAAAAFPGPERRTRRLLLVRGLITGLIGALLVLLTDVTVTAVAIMVGMQMVVSGGVSLLVAVQLRRSIAAWVGLGARGGMALAAGVLALVWPRVTIVVIAVILGIHWLVGGLVSTATAVAVAFED